MFPQSLAAGATRSKEFGDRSSHGTCRDISLDSFSRGPCHAVAPRLWGKGGTCHAVALREGGFTLLELLVVMAIIAILMVLVAPAFTTIKSGSDVTSAANTVKAVLDTARTYAMANNTYTWVGFYEENTTAITPTNSVPPYPGKGRLLLAVVSSNDGTDISLNPLPSSRITQIGKLARIEGIHVSDIGTPAGGDPNTLDGRPGAPYSDNATISSDSSNATLSRFAAQNYTFYKTIRFNPRGETSINSTSTLNHLGEIGIKPTHGNVVDENNTNRVAIQFTGVGGNVTIYRR